jgi:heme A synthase
MKNIKFILTMTLGTIGFALLIWGAIAINQYPGMKEMQKLAIEPVRYQYIIGLVCLVVAYILSCVKKRF